MRRFLPLFCLPFLLNGCIPLLVAGGTETGVSLSENRSVGRKVDDNVLYTDITNGFFNAQEGRLLTDVTFNIRFGRVMLTGRVDNDSDAQKAVALTWKARGVTEVINELIVTKDSGFFDTAKDALIKRNLESRLLFTKDVWVINYSMDVQRGTAYLIGRVKDKGELNRVLNVARSTKGVKRVVSHLQVNPDTQNPITPGATSYDPNAATAAAPVSPVNSSPVSNGPVPQDSTRPLGSSATSGRIDPPDAIDSAPVAAPAK